MKVLIVTNMYPTEANPYWGIFVKEQVDTLQTLRPDWKFDVLVVNGRANRWNYLRGIAAIRNRLAQGAYDIVHAHYGLTGAVARFQLGCPLIVTFHGSDVSYIRWQGWISKMLARVVDQVIVVSARMKEDLNYSKVQVIPCGVNLQIFYPYEVVEAQHKLSLPQNKKVVLFPGDPQNQRKRYDLFRSSLNLLSSKFRLELQEIPLVGISRELMPWYFSAADAILMTSQYEGSPMVIKEALACNLPVVSVDVGDVSELLDGVKHSYVCSREPQELANRLEQVLSSGERSNGRQRIQELRLSLTDTTQRIVEVYEQIKARFAPARSEAAR